MKKVYEVYFECRHDTHDHHITVIARSTEEAIKKAKARWLKGDDDYCASKRSTWKITDVDEKLAAIDIE